jgi:hypothetical protein
MTIRNADNEKNDILITTTFYVGAIAKFYQFFYSQQNNINRLLRYT